MAERSVRFFSDFRQLSLNDKDSRVKAIKTSIILLTLCCLAACATAPGEPEVESVAEQPAQTPVESAAEQYAQPSVTASKPLDNLDEVVCKKIKPTGSRIPKEYCDTRRGWLGLEKSANSTFGEMQRSAAVDEVAGG